MQLAKVSLMDRLVSDKWFRLAINRKATMWFDATMRRFAATNRNIILSSYGPTGSGKSISMIYEASRWALYSGLPFGSRNISFSNQEGLEVLQNAEPKEFNIIDEQVTIFGQGSDREQGALENIEGTIRAKEICLGYCSKKLKIHGHHYYLECLDMKKTDNLSLTLENFENDWRSIQKVLKEDPGKLTNISMLYDGQTERPIGYVATAFPDLPKKFWKSYLERKMTFINAVIKQEPIDRNKEYRHIADDFVENIIIRKDEKFSSKAAMRTMLSDRYKKNFTREEWVTITHIIDRLCREKDIVPYTFSNW